MCARAPRRSARIMICGSSVSGEIATGAVAPRRYSERTMPQPRLVTGDLTQIEDALAAAVAEARAASPLGRITVLIGSSLLRPYLRRAFAARGIAQINVRFVMPHELAAELSA